MNLAQFPRRGYVTTPTPIEHCPNFSKALGNKVNVYIKRDDLRQKLSAIGMAEIAIPKKLIYMENIPLLGNGKTSYVELDEMLKNTNAEE